MIISGTCPSLAKRQWAVLVGVRVPIGVECGGKWLHDGEVGDALLATLLAGAGLATAGGVVLAEFR